MKSTAWVASSSGLFMMIGSAILSAVAVVVIMQKPNALRIDNDRTVGAHTVELSTTTTPPNALSELAATTHVERRAEKLHEDKKKQAKKARMLIDEPSKPQLVNPVLGKTPSAKEHSTHFLPEDKIADAKGRSDVETLIEHAPPKITAPPTTVTVDDGASVPLRGRNMGMLPLAPWIHVDTGRHAISTRFSGRTLASREVDVTASVNSADESTVGASTNEPESNFRERLFLPGWILGIGATLATFLTAGGAVNYGEEAETELIRLRQHTSSAALVCPLGVELDPRCTKLNDLMTQRDNYKNIGVPISVSVLVTAGALVTIALYPNKTKESSQRREKTSIAVIPTRSGVVVSGVF
jgi:hypothetical protein